MHKSILSGGLAVGAAVLVFTIAPANPSYAAAGQQTFARCAACHLPTGAGVPGLYPSLQRDTRILARSPNGRRYLANVLLKGLTGPITSDGRAYRSTMPMQAGLDDAAIAGVLTYVTGTVATGGPAPKPFTTAEIRAARTVSGGLTPASVASSRPATR